MDNKEKQENKNEALGKLIDNTIKNSEQMASILLDPNYEKDLTKDLTPEQKEQFYKSENYTKFSDGKTELAKKLKELQDIRSKK